MYKDADVKLFSLSLSSLFLLTIAANALKPSPESPFISSSGHICICAKFRTNASCALSNIETTLSIPKHSSNAGCNLPVPTCSFNLFNVDNKLKQRNQGDALFYKGNFMEKRIRTKNKVD